MRVDTEMLHSGAAESHRAGDHAQDGANQLSGAGLTDGMFGEFEGAEAFHEAISTAHATHVKALESHSETLRDLGTKTHQAAYTFTATEDHSAKVLRDV